MSFRRHGTILMRSTNRRIPLPAWNRLSSFANTNGRDVCISTTTTYRYESYSIHPQPPPALIQHPPGRGCICLRPQATWPALIGCLNSQFARRFRNVVDCNTIVHTWLNVLIRESGLPFAPEGAGSGPSLDWLCPSLSWPKLATFSSRVTEGRL